MRRHPKKGTVPKTTCRGKGEGCTLDTGHRGECMPTRMPKPAVSSGKSLDPQSPGHSYTWDKGLSRG